jgi:hypothetical protein
MRRSILCSPMLCSPMLCSPVLFCGSLFERNSVLPSLTLGSALLRADLRTRRVHP